MSTNFETSTGFKDVPVKVHVRRPDKDNWAYLGRALVSQELFGNSTRIGMPQSHLCRPLGLKVTLSCSR